MNKETEKKFDDTWSQSMSDIMSGNSNEIPNVVMKRFVDTYFIERESKEFKDLEEKAWKYDDLCK